MAKLFKLVNPNEPGAVGTQSQHMTTDWSKCVLCQEDTDQMLKDPSNSTRDTGGAGYKTIAETLIAFNKISCLPKTLKLSQLDEGQGIEAAFRLHKAKWHDVCRLQYNKTKLHRAEKRKMTQEDDSDAHKFTRRSSIEHSTDVCFFCGQSAVVDVLHNASTFGLDTRVRQCALALQDKPLLAKLSSGDLIAQEAKYHVQCLASLYNRSRDTKEQESNADDVNHGIAFAGLVSYIEEMRMDNLVAPVLKLTDLVNLYSDRLEQLGTHVYVHSTRLKDRILSYFPDMDAHKQGRDTVLVCNEDVGAALGKACGNDTDNEAVHLARAANIVRRDMFKMKQNFSGSFNVNCQEESVPVSLLELVSMVLYGPNITAQSSSVSMPQPALTLAQLLMFNSMVRQREIATTSRSTSRHSQDRETPLPIYLGIMIHTKTRKRALVDTLFDLGLCISYDRVLDISTELGEKICHHYESENAVCPPALKGGLFTTAAVDNIDHNPSSTSAHDSFHGTGISLFQHPDDAFTGIQRDVATNPDSSHSGRKRKAGKLPDTYANVPPVAMPRANPPIPKIEGPNKADCQLIPGAMHEEYRWLDQMKTLLTNDTLNENDTVSWAAYHASLQPPISENSVALTSLLPLFYDQAKSVAMIRHSMDVVKQAVDILNPGQVPIITVDQPLYTLAKQIQWNWPATHGEGKFIVMFGGLHIEMAALKTLGDLLDGSGWTGALVQASVATPGTADSFLKASHVTRTRRAHQVTASSLYLLLQTAYTDYSNDVDEENDLMSQEDWCTERALACPQFHFWFIILQLEIQVLIFVRSIREADFLLYIDALTKIVPWFFALGHIHYARWISVHLRDMISLKDSHPEVYSQFLTGNFAVKKTTCNFSAIAIDQAHEQNNACVKDDGGAVGLTENPAALRRWMVSGPEMARVVGEFEASSEKRKKTDTRHHEQTKHAQIAFARDVRALTGAIGDLGNPFSEKSSVDLLVLDTRNIVDTEVIHTVNHIEKLGQDQYDTFITERLVDQTKPINDPIKRNNLPLFSRPPVREKSRSQQQISSLKNDCSLFSRLYIASQIRDGNLDEFFAHENQACPPALSQMGKLRSCTKSDLVGCLEDLVTSQENASNPQVQVIILDGAALVNMLRPGAATKTFDDYGQQVFSPYILSQLQYVNRVDVVWDEYFPDSLKSETRSKRGKGVRRRVEASSTIPGNWAEFLRIDDNKAELFSFLATSVTALATDKQVISTHQSEVLCTQPRDTSGIAPCTHEEADTRILLHLDDAVNEGYTKVSIRTVDTDVVVLAVTAAQQLNIAELWVAFGTGKNFRHLAAHEMAKALGPDRCIALPMFHAFTGCDTVSSFGGRGKKTAWDTWMSFDGVTRAFCVLAATPDSIDDVMGPLERFVALLYDRTSSQESVDETRKQLFTKKGRTIDHIPPTQAALIQHTKRAAYQAGHCWGQMMVATPELPSPGDWGWKKNDTGRRWEVYWTTLPEATQACRGLLGYCSCTKGCRGHCKCLKAVLKCTALCNCGGLCDQN
jgi:hypothetical protein